MLQREDWLVLFLGLPGGPFPVDQVRAMKRLFLWTQEGPEAVRHLYDFRPYLYGPLDSDIYRDLDRLERQELVHIERVSGTNRNLYWLTPAGEKRYAELAAAVDPATLGTLRRLKQDVTSRRFRDLLDYVYERYPSYAINGVLIERAEALVMQVAADEDLPRVLAEAREELAAGKGVFWSELKRADAARRPLSAEG